MKQCIAVASVLCLLAACSKEKLEKKVTGMWELENFSGYPFNNNYQPPGNGNIILISSDGSFERRKHDTVTFRGAYSIKNKKDCYPRETNWFFSTTEPNSTGMYIDTEDNKLTLSTPGCIQDGGTTSYRKLD
ncbi:MAG: hypothetical protein ABJB86_01880 [Bacteroidota bacterium]